MKCTDVGDGYIGDGYIISKKRFYIDGVEGYIATAGYQGAAMSTSERRFTKRMKTVIPAKATAKVDFRQVLDQDPDDLLRYAPARGETSFARVRKEIPDRRVGRRWR